MRRGDQPEVGERVTSNPLVLKLGQGALLSDAEQGVLNDLARAPRAVAAGKDLIAQGENPSAVRLVMEGFACRYKVLPDGRRQIMALLIPGDFCDLNVSMLQQMDHSIGTLTKCQIVEIPSETIVRLMATHAGISRACSWSTLVDEAILREWLVGMGQRSADRQMAHLFCELLVRLQIVGLATENAFAFPLTQEDLGSVLGLSGVHVNRTLQGLREQNLISLKSGRLVIPEVAELKAFASFSAVYLHHRIKSASQP